MKLFKNRLFDRLRHLNLYILTSKSCSQDICIFLILKHTNLKRRKNERLNVMLSALLDDIKK